jgi:hypothetical protein
LHVAEVQNIEERKGVRNCVLIVGTLNSALAFWPLQIDETGSKVSVSISLNGPAVLVPEHDSPITSITTLQAPSELIIASGDSHGNFVTLALQVIPTYKKIQHPFQIELDLIDKISATQVMGNFDNNLNVNLLEQLSLPAGIVSLHAFSFRDESSNGLLFAFIAVTVDGILNFFTNTSSGNKRTNSNSTLELRKRICVGKSIIKSFLLNFYAAEGLMSVFLAIVTSKQVELWKLQVPISTTPPTAAEPTFESDNLVASLFPGNRGPEKQVDIEVHDASSINESKTLFVLDTQNIYGWSRKHF